MKDSKKALPGEIASAGLAHGTALVIGADRHPSVPRRHLEKNEATAEIEKLDAAIEKTEDELRQISEKVRREMSEKEAEIFEAHMLLLRDPSLREEVSALCLRERINIEAAVEMAIDSLSSAFLRLADPYFRERAADLRDVGARLLNTFCKDDSENGVGLRPGCVIVAEELHPSLAAQLTNETVRAVIVEAGGQTAHATILTRAKRIPMLINVSEATSKIGDGVELIVDAYSGSVHLDPGRELRKKYETMDAELRDRRVALEESIDYPAETRDGVRIKLQANIGNSLDAEEAARIRSDGVGLFRTEFVFQSHDDFPTEEEQTAIYREAADILRPQRIVIRTLDIGSDKHLPYFPMPKEMNPSLGFRGTRVLLAHPEILDVQLRAILRVSATHPVAILFPMVGSVETMRAAQAAVRRAKEVLKAAKIAYNPEIPVGAMIETPAAAIMTSKLAIEADFFSIGTNDLVQYLLTTDRTSASVGQFYEPLHPAVLQRLSSIAHDADKAGIEVSVCGEMAGNPAFVPLLLGLGYRNLSVSTHELLEVKNAIRKVDLKQARSLAEEILELPTIADIKERLHASVENVATSALSPKIIP